MFSLIPLLVTFRQESEEQLAPLFYMSGSGADSKPARPPHYSHTACLYQYKKWLKDEIFDSYTMPDYKKKWLSIKNKNYKFKTDFETTSQDGYEQD